MDFAIFFDEDNFDFFLDDVVELVVLVQTVNGQEDLLDFSSFGSENLFFDSSDSKNLDNYLRD